MANRQHLALIKQEVDAWNKWREENPKLVPNLRGADLSRTNLIWVDLGQANLTEANLRGADLRGAYLSKADLHMAYLNGTNLSKAALISADLRMAQLNGAHLTAAYLHNATFNGADLEGANLNGAYLYRASFTSANLNGANLNGAYLSNVDLRAADLIQTNLINANLTRVELSKANLSGANLTEATLVETNFSKANLDGCLIYGISAWGVNSEGATQSNLVITPRNEPSITIDNLEVAQFIYLLLNNGKIRDVINTITSKAVLILGRFTEERKAVLDSLREELRKRDLLPILFDFDKPSSRNITETVTTLAHVARFVIADITCAKSIPQELQSIVPALPSLPVQPIILASQYEWGMFRDFLDRPSVLLPYRYDSLEGLLAVLEEKVILPAVRKAEEIEERRKVLEAQITSLHSH
jgi:uncharacterized protein YjbI with pentapeptide repeats